MDDFNPSAANDFLLYEWTILGGWLVQCFQKQFNKSKTIEHLSGHLSNEHIFEEHIFKPVGFLKFFCVF